MTTYERVCVKDHTISAQNGDTLTIQRGKKYITSPERDGHVTVFSSFWVEVPADLFADEVLFTGPAESASTEAVSADAISPDAALRAEVAALRVSSEQYVQLADEVASLRSELTQARNEADGQRMCADAWRREADARAGGRAYREQIMDAAKLALFAYRREHDAKMPPLPEPGCGCDACNDAENVLAALVSASPEAQPTPSPNETPVAEDR